MPMIWYSDLWSFFCIFLHKAWIKELLEYRELLWTIFHISMNTPNVETPLANQAIRMPTRTPKTTREWSSQPLWFSFFLPQIIFLSSILLQLHIQYNANDSTRLCPRRSFHNTLVTGPLLFDSHFPSPTICWVRRTLAQWVEIMWNRRIQFIDTNLLASYAGGRE